MLRWQQLATLYTQLPNLVHRASNCVYPRVQSVSASASDGSRMLRHCAARSTMTAVAATAAICLLLQAAVSVRAMSNKGQHTYPYPRPSLTVDAVIVAGGKNPQLLLIQRKNDPFAGSWALPGGFVDEDEPLDRAAARELQEETSVDPSRVLLTQVGAFGDKGRDPRGWCISVAYAALVPTTELGVAAADDAQEAQWYPLDQLPKLAFDHKVIVRTAFRHLAREEAVQKQAGLPQRLQKAADGLEGPWQEQ